MERLTVGGFAKRGGVSARMLRHYDGLGLLCPAYIGENGYRYYDAGQLATLAKIEKLKEYGFKLAEIGPLLALPEELLAVEMHQKRLAAFRRIEAMRKTVRSMESDIVQMERIGLMSDKYEVIEIQQPDMQVLGLRKRISIGQTHELFGELYALGGEKGVRRAGVTQLLYHGQDFDYENMDVEAQMQVEAGGKTQPGGLYLAVTHTGPYETVRYAYEALGAYMKAHPEYRIAGPAIERYLKDEDMADSPEELETAVLFRVEKG